MPDPFPAAAIDALKGRLLVFNVDFVEENLRWAEGTAKPVFYLGKEQAALSNQLEKSEVLLTKLEPKRVIAEKEHETKYKSFIEY